MELTESERLAINAFLAEHWGDFESAAEEYLSPTEVEALGGKLAG